MYSIYSIYSSLVLVSAVLSGLLLTLLLTYWNNRTARALFTLTLTSLGVTISMLLAMYSPDAESAVFWYANIRLIFNGFLAPTGFLFLYAFLGGRNPKLTWLIFSIPLVTVLISLTNSWHHLLFKTYTMQLKEYYLRAAWQPGVWYFVIAIHSYLIAMGLFYLLFVQVKQSVKLPRQRGLLIANVATIITGVMILDGTGYYIAPGLFTAPIGFGLMNLMLIIGVWYLDLFDLLPVAREALIRYMPDAVFVIDNSGIVLEANPAAANLLDSPASEIIGRNIANLVLQAEHVKIINSILSSELHDMVSMTMQGRGRFFDVSVTSIYIENNIAVGKLIVLRDVTQRKRAEEALRKSEELLNITGQMAKVGGWELDAKTLELSWTEQTYRIHEVDLGYKPSLEIGVNFFHPDDRHKLSTAIQRALTYGEPYDMEIRFITARGNHLWTRTICKPQVVNGKTVKLIGTFQDITELKRLQDQDTQRVALEERQRLARDLHDAVSQTLFSARFTSEMLLRQKRNISPRALWQNINHFSELVKSALGEMRVLLLELRPESLVNAELPALLSHLADAAIARVDAKIELDVQGKYDLPVDVKITFYRIAQEALNNIIKHAACSEVSIRLLMEANTVELTVEDNGIGLDVSDTQGTPMGLDIMRERAGEIGANLRIVSPMQAGTRVICTWKVGV